MSRLIAATACALVLSSNVPLVKAASQDTPSSPHAAAGRTEALQIVVVAGEDAVNVIQQKTAVAPVIEVRDRNNQPVSGAVVRFAISRGRATFNGARAFTVTTNAAGRAVAAGLTPTGSGALQISATATFQGQTVVATIAQTNVMTAAAASGATAGTAGAGTGGAGAGGSGAGGTTAGAGGAAGGGGGLSATTIGIIGGAAAGGAVAAKEVLSSNASDFVLYRGGYSGLVNDTFSGSLANLGCTRTVSHNGTVEVEIRTNSDGTVDGEGRVNGTFAQISFSGPNLCAVTSATQTHGQVSPMMGTAAAMEFHGSHPGNPGVTANYDFSGALNGDTVVGTFTFTLTDTNSVDRGVFPVTLQKQ